MPADSVVSTSVVIEAPIEEVWRALTDPVYIRRWFFGVETRTDWRVGGPIVHRSDSGGTAYEDKGTVLAFVEPVMLAFTHWSPGSGKPDSPEWYQTVTFRLAREETVTVLSLTEENPPSPEARAISEEKWDEVLKDLKFLLEEE